MKLSRLYTCILLSWSLIRFTGASIPFRTFTVRPKPPQSDPDPTWPPDFRVDRWTRVLILQVHNHIRSRVSPRAANMLFMLWDRGLEMSAQQWTDNCQWGHDPNLNIHSPKFSRIGQNIWALEEESIRRHKLHVRDVIGTWISEKRDYYFNSKDDHCPFDLCGNYTQVVWAASQFVGCGMKLCSPLNGIGHDNPSVFVACNYGPGGNSDVGSPYEIGISCSKCPNEYNNCVERLCEAFPRCLPVTDCRNVNKTNCLCEDSLKSLAEIRSGCSRSSAPSLIVTVVIGAIVCCCCCCCCTLDTRDLSARTERDSKRRSVGTANLKRENKYKGLLDDQVGKSTEVCPPDRYLVRHEE